VTGRTASVSESFEGSDERGISIHEPGALADLVAASIARGLPVGIHAMGDLGIETAIVAIQRAEEASGGHGDAPRRHRIEHCTLPSEESLATMKSMGIVPLPQPVFLFAEGEAYLSSIGKERCARAYPLQTMLRRGLSPALSSDAPATSWDDPLDPWLGVATAATRRTWAGSILGTDEAISVPEAIATYTINGAIALGIGDRTGSIEVGKDADLIVMPDDPLEVPPESLPGRRPSAVLSRGRLVHGAFP
jgi:predicted amidohydrolase YtcJ